MSRGQVFGGALVCSTLNPKRRVAKRNVTRRAVMFLTAAAVLAVSAPGFAFADIYTVKPVKVSDEKAVFATVESANVVPARARIGGTVANLSVTYGDHVERGQTLATIGDEKLVLRAKSLEAQIAGLEAQLVQATTDLERAQSLFDKGTIARARLDEARTAFNVATNTRRSRIAEREVIEQQLSEGNVLAPTAGRVLKVPLTPGSVVLPGEPIAMIAEQNFVLRLRVPERHARFLKVGDAVRLDKEVLAKDALGKGTIRLVYPQIEDGRVVADAKVSGLGDYFVGERVRVWVSGGEREAIVIPARLVTTRFGVDYVHLQRGDNSVIDVPVQRGREHPLPDMPDGLEILSGLKAGDRLVQP